jgi:hypothetical protein
MVNETKAQETILLVEDEVRASADLIDACYPRALWTPWRRDVRQDLPDIDK